VVADDLADVVAVGHVLELLSEPGRALHHAQELEVEEIVDASSAARQRARCDDLAPTSNASTSSPMCFESRSQSSFHSSPVIGAAATPEVSGQAPIPQRSVS
jgi:hypothetical protein